MFNQKKSFAALLILFSLAITSFYSCGDDTNTITNPPGETPYLTGTITNYPGGSIIAKAKLTAGLPADSFFAGTDTIDNSGMLNMDLATPPANFLTSINDLTLPSGVVVSDTTARIAQIGTLRAYGFSNELIGMLQKKNFMDSVVTGSFAVQYLYSTKPFTITGSDTMTSVNDTTINIYNVSFVAGWNAYTVRAAERRPGYSRYEVITGEAAGATWYYTTTTLDVLRKKNFLIN